jgi:hypothetical protein
LKNTHVKRKEETKKTRNEKRCLRTFFSNVSGMCQISIWHSNEEISDVFFSSRVKKKAKTKFSRRFGNMFQSCLYSLFMSTYLKEKKTTITKTLNLQKNEEKCSFCCPTVAKWMKLTINWLDNCSWCVILLSISSTFNKQLLRWYFCAKFFKSQTVAR